MRGKVRQARRLRLATGLVFAFALSLLAGMTDAIGFLEAGHYVSFMSGNTTRFAIAIAAADWHQIGHLGFVLLCFVAGNMAGAVFMRLLKGSHAAFMLGLATVIAGPVLLDWPHVGFLCLVFAMGALNVALEQVDGHAVGITYVTGALSRFGRSLGRLALGHAAPGWWIQIVPWAGMLAGAVAGAVVQTRYGNAAALIPAALAVLLGLASLAIPGRWRRGYRQPKPFARSAPPLRKEGPSADAKAVVR